MKICFVDPKGIHLGINTGIGYLVSSLRSARVAGDVKVFDFNNNKKNTDFRLEEIRGYDIVGFSMKSFTKDAAIEVAQKVKRPGNVLIAGGPHIALDGVNFMKEHPIFDFAVRGEGEITFARLVNALGSGADPGSINGIIRRFSGDIVSTGPGERIKDLDSVPFPDYSVFDSIDAIRNYPLVTSRGCPYLCTYCCVKDVMGRKWFARNVDGIIRELEEAKRKYNIESFNVQDDNFSLDIKRAKEFCDRLAESGLDLKWSCPNGIRADRVDEELMRKMRKSGCFAIALGIESGVSEEFDAIKKGEGLDAIVKTAELARENKIWVFGNFIIGLPHSTLASIRESVKFAKSLRLESCIFNLLVPFPGTEVYEWAKANGKTLMDWKDGFTQGKNPKVVFETPEFPERDRLRAYWESNIKCKNYFACMDEHEGLLSNILNVLKNIVRYDLAGIPGHIIWCLKHAGRISARVKASRRASRAP